MAVVFETRPGTMLAIPSVTDVPIPLVFDGWGGAFGFRSIISQMAIDRGENIQFMHSLRDLIHVYVFGARMGRILISGISFADQCPGASPRSGIEYVLNYYEQYRAGRRGVPVTIQLGATQAGRFGGFLTGLNVNLQQTEQRMATFGLSFSSFPRVG
jgi:hypothetical protein